MTTRLIELRVLGALRVTGPDHQRLHALESQPKRLALLLYLVLCPRPPRRDVLLATFWPELDQERSRAALRQTLWFLRRQLGAEALVALTEDVGVDDDVVRSDVTMFERAFATGEYAAALGWYGGDLAQGFYWSDCTEVFERWLDAERARLRRMALSAASTLVQRATARGDADTALTWARRAAAIAPDDETVVRQLLVALDHAGDRAGALAVHDDFRRRLESEFGASPAPETEAIVHRLRTRRTPWPSDDHARTTANGSAPTPVHVSGSRRAEALTAMGIGATHYFWRWEEAERRFRSAQAVDPGYWPALHWYSHLLMAQGRVEESLDASRRAIALVPHEPIAAVHLAWHFWLARDAASAIRQSEHADTLSPESPWPTFMFGMACALEARYDRAIPALRTAVIRSAENPVMLAALGVCHAEAGDDDAARATLRRLQLQSARHRLDYHIALVHAGLRETADALRHLERALEARLGWIAYLDVDPRLDRLRDDPRFTRLVEARNSSRLATLSAD